MTFDEEVVGERIVAPSGRWLEFRINSGYYSNNFWVVSYAHGMTGNNNSQANVIDLPIYDKSDAMMFALMMRSEYEEGFIRNDKEVYNIA